MLRTAGSSLLWLAVQADDSASGLGEGGQLDSEALGMVDLRAEEAGQYGRG